MNRISGVSCVWASDEVNISSERITGPGITWRSTHVIHEDGVVFGLP